MELGGRPPGSQSNVAPPVLQQYLGEVCRAIMSEAGASLASLLKVDKSRLGPSGGALLAAARAAGSSLRDVVGGVLCAPSALGKGKYGHAWRDVVALHLNAAGAAGAGAAGDAAGPDAAVTASGEAASVFVALFVDDELMPTNWAVPVLHALVRDAYTCIRAYTDSSRVLGVRDSAEDRSDSLVTKAVRPAIMHAFKQKTPKDQYAASKKTGVLYLVNLVLSILYRRNSMKQGKAYLKFIPDDALAKYPVAQVVTSQYYVGVLAAYEDDYPRAYAHLCAALRLCHRDYRGNVRSILKMLVPVSIYAMGRLPSRALLERYDLAEQYGDLVDAFRTGDILRYNACVEKHGDWYIREGVYLTLERMQILIYRTLF